MPLSPTVAKNRVRDFKFRELFVQELGWDRPAGAAVDVPLDGHTYRFTGVAEKRGFRVFECVAPAADAYPDYATRARLDRQLSKSAFEHLVIYTDPARTRQTWATVRREAGAPPRLREEAYTKGDSGERLVQKLQRLAFALDEEDALTLTDVRSRAGAAFDVERVTKKFFDRFQEKHAEFVGFIQGLADAADRAWYASLMMNRLMFAYFIQKKGFLDNDPDYLRTKLKQVQAQRGKDEFDAFYRHFLMRLFQEGFGKKRVGPRPDLDKLLGVVPYLNGGLFDLHELEAAHAGIRVPDEAFEKLFAFFDNYRWHLDERPLRADNEINPDVLGYIFEKYINQKQMGAYYTKEDITGYITRNSLLPFVLGRAAELCAAGFTHLNRGSSL